MNDALSKKREKEKENGRKSERKRERMNERKKERKRKREREKERMKEKEKLLLGKSIPSKTIEVLSENLAVIRFLRIFDRIDHSLLSPSTLYKKEKKKKRKERKKERKKERE